MSLLSRLLVMPKSALVILAAAAGAMAFAFVMEYVFHYDPCELCLMQRIPFVVVILLSALSLPQAMRRYAGILLGLCGLAFLVGTGIAVFHTGVEREWWMGTSGCVIKPLHESSVESLREKLLHMATASCMVISWKFLGLSMANYNIPFSFLLSLFSFAAAKKARA